MEPYVLLAFISLFGLVVSDRVEEYKGNFLENLRRDVERIEAPDKVDIENLFNTILSFSADTKDEWNFSKVLPKDILRAIAIFLKDKTGQEQSENKNLDGTFEQHVHQLCMRVSENIAFALTVFTSDRAVREKLADDELMRKWISIGQFCNHVNYLHKTYQKEIRMILSKDKVPSPSRPGGKVKID